MNAERLLDMARKAGFTLPDHALEPLSGYLSELHRWNRVMNLVGARSEADIFALFTDSFYLADFLTALPLPAAPECWDLGAGAGLPGIPLRALWQAGSYTLIDSREKRTLFLQTTLARHPLPGTAVFHGRAETFMFEADTPRRADLILSRAFMPPETLLPFVNAHLTPEGLLILLLNAPLTADAKKDWRTVSTFEYRVGSASRYFEAIRPLSAC